MANEWRSQLILTTSEHEHLNCCSKMLESEETWNPPLASNIEGEIPLQTLAFQGQTSVLDDISGMFTLKPTWGSIKIMVSYCRGQTTERRDYLSTLCPVRMQFLATNHVKKLQQSLENSKCFDTCSISCTEDESLKVEIKARSNINVINELDILWSREVNNVILQKVPAVQLSVNCLIDLFQEENEKRNTNLYSTYTNIYIVGFASMGMFIEKCIDDVNRVSEKQKYSFKIVFDPLILKLLKHENAIKLLRSQLQQNNDSLFLASSRHLWIFSQGLVDTDKIKGIVYKLFASTAFEITDFNQQLDTSSITKSEMLSLILERSNDIFVKHVTSGYMFVASTVQVIQKLWQREENFSTEYLYSRLSSISQEKKDINKLQWGCKVVNPAEVNRKSFESVRTLEAKFHCSIELNNVHVQRQQIAQWVNWDKQLHIVLVYGSYLEMPVDVICVNTEDYEMLVHGQANTGKDTALIRNIGKNIAESSCVEAHTIKTKAAAVNLTTETGYLPCFMVALFNQQNQKTPEDQVKSLEVLLTTVDNKGLHSITIPTDIINPSTEMFCDCFSTAFQTCRNRLKKLKTIYLSVDTIQSVSVMVDHLTKELKYLAHYDFLSMLEDSRNPAYEKSTVSLKVVHGNIEDQELDVLVNSTNCELDLRKGVVSASILLKGGEDIMSACNENHPKGINFGEVIHSTPGKLKCEQIFHFALPNWILRANFSLEILAKSMFNCLSLATNFKYKSIGFPVFGTGSLQYPWSKVAHTMIETVRKFCRMCKDTTLEEVYIVVHPDNIQSTEIIRQYLLSESKLVPEDHVQKPRFLLEARWKGIRMQVTFISAFKFLNCEAAVEIYYTEKEDLDKLVKVTSLTNELHFRVFTNNNEENYRSTISKILEMSLLERLCSLVICLMTEKGSMTYMKQANIILEMVSQSERSRYLESIQMVVSNRLALTKMVEKIQNSPKFKRKSSLFKIKSRETTPKFKTIRYEDISPHSKLVITASGKDMDEVNLQNDLQAVIFNALKEERTEL